jgi:hypothetical protein
MNAPVLPEKLLPGSDPSPQAALALATPGVQRWVWEGLYGPMLIEVSGNQVFVNGQRVEPHASPDGPRGPRTP